MPESPRIAQPGDVFFLLVPTGAELARLQQQQHDLQARFGGQLVQPIHVTVERFSPENGQFAGQCLTRLREILSTVRPFPLFTDMLIQFFAPYWQRTVLRWRVQQTPLWHNFRDLLETTLAEVRCPSHFIRERHATCTILSLSEPVELSTMEQATELPNPLFTVRELWVSELQAKGHFQILEKLEIE
jgi:hypothetical protein